MKVEKKNCRTLPAALFGIATALCFAQGVMAQTLWHEYLISGSEDQFTASRFLFTGPNVITNQPIQSVIDAIKADAAGNPCVIQFGNEIETIDIDYDYISFESGSSGNNWGLITLKGKITSASTAVIVLYGGVSVNSTAGIINTAPAGGSNPQSYGIMHNSTGTLTISGGEVSSPFGSAVYNNSSGPVVISGGTVSTETGIAVSNNSTAQITISGGTVSATTGIAVRSTSTGLITLTGNALVTSANTGPNTGTVSLTGGTGTSTANRLVIHSGSTVENTANSANAKTIHSASPGAVDIGGRVLAKSGYAVYKTGTGAVNLTGMGLVFAYGKGVDNVIYGAYTQNDFSLIVAWDQAAENTNYARWSSTDLFIEAVYPYSPLPIPLATATWNEPNRITYSHGSNMGFIEIDGVTVSPTSIKPSARVRSTNSAQFVQASGRTLQLRFPERGKVAIYALNGARVRTFDLGQGAHTLRLNGLPRGTYMVKSTSGAWKQTVRMVVR